LGTVADLKVSSNFDLPQVSLVYPPNQGQSAARVTPKKTRMSPYSIVIYLYIDFNCNSAINVDVGASEKMTGHANIRIIPHASNNLCTVAVSLLIRCTVRYRC
jgi:hypothetical protein